MDWTQIPDWLSALSSLGALAFAAVAAIAAMRVYRIESSRDEANAETRKKQESLERRSQAALVSAWWGHDDADAQGNGVWGVYVRNASETPVYDAKFSVLDIHDPNASERFDLAVVPPASEPVVHSSPVRTEHPEHCRVEVTFTDSAGRRWIRDRQGQLHELGQRVLIWGDAKRVKALRQFFTGFLAEFEVEARFRTGKIEELRDELLDTGASDPVPDIVIGPHDWIGGLVESGLIEPILLSPKHREAFDPLALKAMAYRGDLYGIPYAFDSTALIRNTDLAPEAPSSFEDMLATGEELRRTGAVEHSFVMQVPDPYYMYPVVLAGGGRFFGSGADGSLNPPELHVDTPSSRLGFERFRELGSAGLDCLRPGIGRDEAVELFVTGRTPYLLCTSRMLSDAQQAGLRFAVDAVPPFEGVAPIKPMVSVHGFFLTRRGRNKAIARDLIVDHLTRSDVSSELRQVWPHVPTLREVLDSSRESDPAVRSFYEACRVGDLMPSIPEMGEVWAAMQRTMVQLVDGDEVAPAARQLSRRLEEVLGRRAIEGLPGQRTGERID